LINLGRNQMINSISQLSHASALKLGFKWSWYSKREYDAFAFEQPIVKHVKAADADFDRPFQMQIRQLDYNYLIVALLRSRHYFVASVKTG